jgi:hypothetical protein
MPGSNGVSAGVAALVLIVALLGGDALHAQEPVHVARVAAQPERLRLITGEAATLRVTAYDADGRVLHVPIGYAAPLRGLRTLDDGTVIGVAPGDWEVVVYVQPHVLPPDMDTPPVVRVPVTVVPAPVAAVRVEAAPGTLYQGTTLRHEAVAFQADGTPRPDVRLTWHSSDPAIASVDRFGAVTAHRRGAVTIMAEAEGVRDGVHHEVRPFPATRLEFTLPEQAIRTGDVLPLEARASDPGGRPVDDLPVAWSYEFEPAREVGSHAGAGAVIRFGRFVAEAPGRYTVMASAGPLTARQSVQVVARDVVRPARKVGHGRVSHVQTSDFWVWRAHDGRDYAITGTWGGDGVAYIWDVTDPANLVRTDSIRVDARTVNDVKVSPDGRYATLTREGASDRRNGLVILDLADPAHPTIAAQYDEGLTGGVHNAFPTNDYAYALSGGQKFVILDVRDITNPRYVGEYRHPGGFIHDVHVHDGIAYASQWEDGVVVVDVGNGRWGGSRENPVFVLNVTTPGGATHTSFPYTSASTGRFYVIAGDEIIGRPGRAWGEGLDPDVGLQRYDPETGAGGQPGVTAGYYHFIDFTDFENPQIVARYEVPEFGTHNHWAVDDILYTAYYEGGMRVVDISGDLVGDLARQGREIAVFKAFDPAGFIANAPNAWSAHPHAGKVFFSDFYSGLWSVEVDGLVDQDHCHSADQDPGCPPRAGSR